MKKISLPVSFGFLFVTAIFLLSASAANAQNDSKHVLFFESKVHSKLEIKHDDKILSSQAAPSDIRTDKNSINKTAKNQVGEKVAADTESDNAATGETILRQWYVILDKNLASKSKPAKSTEKTQKKQ